VLNAHRPAPGLLATLSPAGARVLQIVQSKQGLDTRLDRLRPRWRRETLIHGDIKSDNILIRPSRTEPEPRPTEVSIVDWEFVQIGDPAWDLAGALHDFLIFWTASMPLGPSVSAEAMMAQARYPLECLQPAIRALWDGYQAAAKLGPSEAEDLLPRAVEFSAERLIQASYELAVEKQDLPDLAVVLLQISANILADPDGGRVQLYGIPEETGLE
jgi:aminoglycoside phosphotransferase (APT) family kinase protein